MNEPGQRDRMKRDAPYLMFEITSDDGFSVQADTCEGNVQIRILQGHIIHLSEILVLVCVSEFSSIFTNY